MHLSDSTQCPFYAVGRTEQETKLIVNFTWAAIRCGYYL